MSTILGTSVRPLAPPKAVPRQLRMRQDAVLAQPPELEESQQIHQPVPVNGQWSELEGNGIELGVNQHGY
jgi:hypothetical protein